MEIRRIKICNSAEEAEKFIKEQQKTENVVHFEVKERKEQSAETIKKNTYVV